MADVELQREEEGEKAAPEESLLNGEAGEKDEVDPSEETAKKRRKKKKKKSAALAGKLERPRAACIRSNAGAYSSYSIVVRASSDGAHQAVKLQTHLFAAGASRSCAFICLLSSQ